MALACDLTGWTPCFKGEMGRGARAKVVCFALCTFITMFPNSGMSVRLKQFRHRGNTCVVRDLQGSTGAQCGAAG